MSLSSLGVNQFQYGSEIGNHCLQRLHDFGAVIACCPCPTTLFQYHTSNGKVPVVSEYTAVAAISPAFHSRPLWQLGTVVHSRTWLHTVEHAHTWSHTVGYRRTDENVSSKCPIICMLAHACTLLNKIYKA